MRHTVKELRHFILSATDGEIGEVKDVYFDDRRWAIRYIVVDTGRFLHGRKVLVSPRSVRGLSWDDRIVNVELTRQQVRDSPGIDTHQPVSRQHRLADYNRYGYPNYWEGSNPWGLGFYPVPWVGASPDAALSSPRIGRMRARERQRREDRKGAFADAHLRSSKEVIGYEVMASDGTVGTVQDFICDDVRWAIPYMVIRARKWLRVDEVLLSPRWVASVSWSEHEVYVDATRRTVGRLCEVSSRLPSASPPAKAT